MKDIKELLKLAKTTKNTDGKVGVGNFLSYRLEDNKARLHYDYESAKQYAIRGGQVLVIDKEKLYNYKVKNEAEYDKYLRNQIWQERHDIMNKYGL